MDRLNIVAIIPARYGSTRLPAKPLVDLCGKPMIQRVVGQAQRCGLINRVIVATDDERIASAVRSFGGEVAMTNAEIRTGTDRIAAVAESLPDADIIVNVQGDEPLIAPQMIDEAIRPVINDTSLQAATIVKRITDPDELKNPNTVKVVLDGDGNGIYFSRSPIPHLRENVPVEQWLLRQTYYKHFGLYVFRRNFLLKFSQWPESALEKAEKLEQLRIIEHGHRIRAVVTEYDSFPVDTPDDAERLRQIIKRHETVGVT